MQSTRSSLERQAKKLRFFQTILSFLDRYLTFPLPLRPALTTTIPTTISSIPGEITLYIYTNPDDPPISTYSTTHEIDTPRRPILINFHSGGFSIGHAIDDARWISSVLKKHPSSLVVSVNYRLAPEYPYPIPMEDCVDALLWLWDHAENYNLDRKRFICCGGSAGGNLALTVPLRLYEELEKRGRRDTKRDIQVAGALAFYPSVDWTKSRAERDATNPIAAEKSMIPPTVFTFFDKSYLVEQHLPKRECGRSSTTGENEDSKGDEEGEGGSVQVEVDMGHPYLSPGLTPTNLLLAAFPPCVTIYTCGWDQLLVEGNTLRERICRFVDEGRMRHCGGYEVEDAIHGFDKRPSFCLGNEVRDKMYSDAVEQLAIMWACEHESEEEGSDITV
ncbi:hypothetical protein N7488_003406 [Penicillium malachiteum]|nr:hypothetical protein N7488_003406 [Penicillium malachiteum]